MLTKDMQNPAEHQWCASCRKHRDGHCDGCGAAFLPAERRYRSQSIHYHPAAIAGVSGTLAVHSELCVECYRLDHAAVYPDSVVPDLPDRGVDERFHAARASERRRARVRDLVRESASRTLDAAELAEVNAAIGSVERFL